MIKAEERNETQQGKPMSGSSGPQQPPGGSSPSKSSVIPKCVCSWKNCRVYQKFFRDHPVLEGVVRLKFTTTEPESMALKASIDRNLKVSEARSQDRKPGKHPGQEVIKYNVACHHWTEQHVRKYKADPKHYSFVKPFSVHGAAKYLYKVDERETFKDPTGREREPLYLQSPLVPKEAVKNLFYQIKEDSEQNPNNNQNQQQQPSSSLVQQLQLQQQPSNDLKEDLRSHPKQPTSRKNSPTAVGKDDPGYSPEDDKKDNATVSSSRSNKTPDVLLQEKEVENKRLKEQLESMQSQLSFLHDMVSKLQEEHYDHHSTRSGSIVGHRLNSRHRRKPHGGGAGGANNDSRRTGSRSSRSSVPNEIEIESEDDGGWVEPAIDEEWSEEDEDDDDGEQSQGTFHVTYQAQVQRRNSFSSRASRTSRATSIVSASKSIKSLPRDIEIEDDEDDDESHESLEEEAIDCNKSFASSKKSVRSGRSFGTMGNRRTSLGVTAKKPSRRLSVGESSRAGSVAGSRASKKSQKHGGSSENGSISAVYQVTALTVTDPYGEQGTYTGSISSSTGMPHGFGRLEYDKAGRWYEGDWKHGRWTGQGRLSNGDGDFYEGGLKNDHKHGRGVMKFADGRTFEGEYVNGQMVEGTMTYQDGSTYAGGWADGMRHGRGRCVFTDQSIYEGEFREGEFFGHGKMSWSDGGWYEGEWWNGDMQGYGKEVRPDGSLRHEGQWAKGQPIRK